MNLTILLLIFMFLFVSAWIIVESRKDKVVNDLIYLEYLIRNWDGLEPGKSNITEIINDYQERPEYQSSKFYELRIQFRKKSANVEALRDKLTKIEVERMERFDAVNSFEG